MNKGKFVTSRSTVIPASVMAKVQADLMADRDWQEVATDYLHPLIPESDEDLDEVNEVLNEAERRGELAP